MPTNNIDYIPHQPFTNGSFDHSQQQLMRAQRQKWFVLLGTFLLVYMLASLWVWTRPAIYSSKAVLLFTFPAQTELEFSELVQRKVEAHQQKLLSHSLTQSVLHTLEQNVGLQVTPESKPQLFSAAANGRFITLSANHHSAEILQPVLSTWIAEYLALESAEKVKNNSQNLASSNTQLQSIEQKITAKQRAIELFAKENDITSLERDENRVLNKIKALSANLDQAIAERTAAQSSLNSLLESVNKGQSIIRDIDKEQINKTRQELQLLQSELTALESKYTQVYLARDPVIVAKQQTQLALKQSLAEQLEQSQQYYLQEAERDLSQSIDNVKQTERQFRLENKQAQDFSQRLQAYKVLTTELDAIQQQAQTIRDNLVVQEVSKPFDATITILEQPFTPESPTGPDYWRMTIFSLLASLGCGVFALLLFGYIVKQKQPTNTATNFVVMPGQPGQGPYNQLSNEQHTKLNVRDPHLRLGEHASSHVDSLRILSVAENQALYRVANKQGKVLLALLYSGVQVEELALLSKTSFKDNYARVQILGEQSRILNIDAHYSLALAELCESKNDSDPIWSNLIGKDDFTQIILNAAHDAELAFPDQLSADTLRHSYITYLVSQGARLNDLELIVGHIPPRDLAEYRKVKRQGPLLELADIDLYYQLIS